jgi:hypothetical protein
MGGGAEADEGRSAPCHIPQSRCTQKGVLDELGLTDDFPTSCTRKYKQLSKYQVAYLHFVRFVLILAFSRSIGERMKIFKFYK